MDPKPDDIGLGKRLFLGCLGALAPILVNLYVVDLQTTLANLLPLEAVSYCVRLLALCISACVIVYLNADEMRPKSIHEIKKRDVSDLVSLIAQRNAHASHRLLKTLKTFFKWCVGRAIIDFSPADGLSSGYREASRDRVLTDQELAAIILGARQMPHPYSGIVEFLALTGQRREEVAQLKRNELDEQARSWTIPGARTKNKKAHIVHLSEPAWRVVTKTLDGDLVFGTSGGKRFQAFGKEKRGLDKLSGVTGWRLHDMRRTIVSGMARLGVPPHVADKILNHQAGTISGVAAVYQRHDFLVECKEALDRWGAHVEQIIQQFNPKTDKRLFVSKLNEHRPTRPDQDVTTGA